MGQARDEAGNLWETDAQGNAVRLISQAGAPSQGGIYTLPQSPDKARQQSLEEQRVANAAAANAEANAIRKAQLDANLYAKGLRMGANGQIEPIPGWSPPMTAASSPKITANVRRDAIDQFKNASSLERIAADLMEKYKVGPGATTGIAAIQDYLPLAKNQVLDQTANQARGYVKSALGFTGGEGNTIGEIALNYGPYLPEASDKDAVIVQKIEALRNLAADARAKATTVLGGTPDANGQIVPQNAMDQVNVVGGQTQAMAPGSNANAVANLPPEAQAEYQAYLTQNAGRLDPNAYAQFRLGLAEKYGIQDDPARASIYAQEAASLNDYFAKGGRTFSTPTVDQPMTGVDRLRNAAVNNPFGAAVVGAADAGGFGAVSALAGDQMDALRDANPISSIAGGAVGAIGATGALGKLGRTVSQGLAPKLLQGGGRAQFGRNLATDATYGGIYGTATEGDPLTGAVVGGVASGLGQGIGSGLGRAVGGVTSSPTVSRLRDMGVTPTLGQIMRGRAVDNGSRSFVAGAEDVIANTGMVGSLVNSARNRALEEANTAGYRIAADGAPINGVGQDALEQLTRVKNDAYDTAVGGRTFDMSDPTFAAQAAAARSKGAQIDSMRRGQDFGIVDQFELGPIVGSGPMLSGKQWQDAQRLLEGQKTAFGKAATGPQPDPSANQVANALDELRNAFVGLAARQAPDAIPALKQANRINRNLSVLDDAAGRAMKDGGVWTASQLGDAMKANSSKFGGNRGLRAQTKSPLYQLQQDMQAVLPNQVPPTGVNVAPALALAGAAMGGTGFATDNSALSALGAALLASTPYTKVGQKAVAKALLDRPDAAKAAGSLIRKRKGLFGSASVPLMLEATQ